MADPSIAGLVAQLRSGRAQAQAGAARQLGNLAANNAANKAAIASEGAIGPLVALVRGGSAEAQWCAAYAR